MPHRKQVKHYDEPGHVHELTFSCYQRRRLLTDERNPLLAEAVDRAVAKHGFRLVAYVFMPEHVHLLVWPEGPQGRISPLLKSIKQPASRAVKRALVAADDPLLGELTIRERPGKRAFRFWQEGGGYDRNLTEPGSTLAAIDYIHENPVRRKLATRAIEWSWSSASFYINHPDQRYNPPPTITPLPAEFFAST